MLPRAKLSHEFVAINKNCLCNKNCPLKKRRNFFLVSTEQTKDERNIEENKSRKQILFTYTEVDMKESETPLRFKM